MSDSAKAVKDVFDQEATRDMECETLCDTLSGMFYNIRARLIMAVLKRLESDRPLGALLSGGLDSSLVVAIAAQILRLRGAPRLRTFSIGIPGSTDRAYAEMVAKHCDTDHTHVEFTIQQFLDAIEHVVIATETWDTTSVRASVGQYLISKWIRENTNIKVLLIGDGSDELTAGYMYFHNAPSPEALHAENVRLIQDIQYYDVLRADRCVAYNGLEARVPFLDHHFVDYYLSIDPSLRVPRADDCRACDQKSSRKIEKWLLRKSFDSHPSDSHPSDSHPSDSQDSGTTGKVATDEEFTAHLTKMFNNEVAWLPPEVLWRKKEAFSDGVSSREKSWYQIIQEHVEELYTEEDFKHPDVQYHIVPPTKEALHYRLLFNKHFHPQAAHVVPYYWMPKWSGDNIKDPSARVLQIYQEE